MGHKRRHNTKHKIWFPYKRACSVVKLLWKTLQPHQNPLESLLKIRISLPISIVSDAGGLRQDLIICILTPGIADAAGLGSILWTPAPQDCKALRNPGIKKKKTCLISLCSPISSDWLSFVGWRPPRAGGPWGTGGRTFPFSWLPCVLLCSLAHLPFM